MTPAVLLGLTLALGAPALKERKAPSVVGTWEVESITINGRVSSTGTGLTYTFSPDGTWVIHRNGKQTSPSIHRGYKVIPKGNPPGIELITNTATGIPLTGIYKIEGDRLTICGTRAREGKPPTKFESEPGSLNTLYVLRRARKD